MAEGHDIKTGLLFVTRVGNFLGKSNFASRSIKPTL